MQISFRFRIVSKAMEKVRRIHHIAFEKKLFITNVATAVILGGIGDIIEQKRMRTEQIDLKRTQNLTVYGFTTGIIDHHWYQILDKYITSGSVHTIVAKKLFLDQLVLSPFYAVFFLTQTGLLEGESLENVKTNIRNDAVDLFLADCVFWVPVQVMNFYLVPSRFRVVFISGVALIWNVFLSYFKYDKEVENGGCTSDILVEINTNRPLHEPV